VPAQGGVVRVQHEARGEGRPVLFIHGLTFDRRMLLEASEPAFEGARARRLYVDLPGHGATPADERAASAEGLVAALAAFVDESCDEPPLVVGHSYGAYLALGLMATRPVSALLLVAPVVEPDVARRVVAPRRVAVREDALAFGEADDERATFEEVSVVQTHTTLAAYQRLVQPASVATDRAFLGLVRQRYVLPWPFYARLAELALPVSIVCGRDDHWVGYTDAQALLRASPHAELQVLPDCGQLLPLEAPTRYREAVTGFLARNGYSRIATETALD
jgi:pimeloyl-ACP methyl ester carboxylesterase